MKMMAIRFSNRTYRDDFGWLRSEYYYISHQCEWAMLKMLQNIYRVSNPELK